MIRIPLLRYGKPYHSMDVAQAVHFQTREPIAEISQANVGLIRRDMLRQAHARDILAELPVRQLIEITRHAGDIFLKGRVPLNDHAQTPEDYVLHVSATTGMPHAMVRRNLQRIYNMFANIEAVLQGLTRGLDLAVLDRGYSLNGSPISFHPRGNSLGVILPSNSPGVHSLWVPSVCMKTPLVLKPGSAEPWTPWRIIQAFLMAGLPPEAFCYYPTDHAGGNEILRQVGRGMLFGDVGAVKGWAKDPRIELHGPGYSKIVIGEDCIEDWPKYVDLMAKSVAENGGRSCVNCSGIWVPRYGNEIARAVAGRLLEIQPRSADDPDAVIAPIANPDVGRRVTSLITQGLADAPGAVDVSEQVRGTPRLVEHDGCVFLVPTIVHCDSPCHPMANKEYLFPFASVVEAPQEEMPEILGPTLVVTALTKDREFLDRLLTSHLVGRLNIGPVQTNVIQWDQPHEGNLFDHLWARRAFAAAQPELVAAW
jgi:acyl-CoA reductase-like NAD-dependent aldehyde dehydrogenase